MKSKIICLLVIGLVVFVSSGVIAQEEVIKIGVFEPMTGPFAVGGEISMQGYRLAQMQNPTVLGKKVKLIVVDNKSDKVEAANAVSKLVEKDDVVAILGSYSSGLSLPGVLLIPSREKHWLNILMKILDTLKLLY